MFIPLIQSDPAAKLDLQQALDRVYDSVRCAAYVCENRPQPPLVGDDLAWVRQFLPRAAR